jgi:hypothetical protein
MPDDRWEREAREWLSAGHKEAVKPTHRDEFTENLAAKLHAVDRAAAERERADRLRLAEACVRAGKDAFNCAECGWPNGNEFEPDDDATIAARCIAEHDASPPAETP